MDTFSKEEIKNFIIGLCVICVFALGMVIFKLQRNVWKGAENTDYQIYATFNRPPVRYSLQSRPVLFLYTYCP